MPGSGTGIPIDTITAGESVNYNLKIVPTGFVGNVTMGCTWPNGQLEATSCMVSPTSATLDGTNSADANVSVTTTIRPSASGLRQPPPPTPPGHPALYLAIWVLKLATLANLLLRRGRIFLGLASVLFMVLLWSAWGGGGSVRPFVAPAGTYSLSVNGTSTGVTRSTTVTLVVN